MRSGIARSTGARAHRGTRVQSFRILLRSRFRSRAQLMRRDSRLLARLGELAPHHCAGRFRPNPDALGRITLKSIRAENAAGACVDLGRAVVWREFLRTARRAREFHIRLTLDFLLRHRVVLHVLESPRWKSSASSAVRSGKTSSSRPVRHSHATKARSRRLAPLFSHATASTCRRAFPDRLRARRALLFRTSTSSVKHQYGHKSDDSKAPSLRSLAGCSN